MQRGFFMALAWGAFGVALALAGGLAHATSPGTNGPIAWQSLTGTHGGGGNEIWTMNANGSGKDPLTDNAVHDERPSISADGTKITFMSFRATDDSWEIYKMNVDGSNQTALTDDDDTDFEPSWAPDGSKIVFQRQTTGLPAGEVAGQDLWTVPVGGGTATNLTNTPIAYECCAEYSPDGTKIAFTNSGHVDGNPMGPYDDNEIWVMNANGTNQIPLTDNTAQDVGPTWSPDGSKIAWAVDGAIWTMNADGSNEAALTGAGSYYAPVWSPDGTRIAAQGGSSDILSVSVANPLTDVVNLTQGNGVQDEYPSWAPAGAGAPDTEITKAPDAVIHKDSATYRFKALPAAGATFKCKLDSKPYKNCDSPKDYNNLANGRHTFRVRASAGGLADPTPARDSFKVKP